MADKRLTVVGIAFIMLAVILGLFLLSGCTQVDPWVKLYGARPKGVRLIDTKAEFLEIIRRNRDAEVAAEEQGGGGTDNLR